MEFFQKYWIYGLGFFAQALFGTRLLVQLFHSERQGKVASPTIFWQISLFASFLFLVYGILRDDFVIILGQTLSYFIYIRNLQLKDNWRQVALPFRSILLILPFAAFSWTLLGSQEKFATMLSKNDLFNPIIILGSIGQLMLGLRFVYQWYYSEKQKTSVLPLGFWLISVAASVLILRYALYKTDPVLLVSQGMGMFVYVRNIMMHFRTKPGTRAAH